MNNFEKSCLLMLSDVEADSLLILLKKLKETWKFTKQKYLEKMANINNELLIEAINISCNRKINAYLSIMSKIDNSKDYISSDYCLVSLDKIEITELLTVFSCYKNSSMKDITLKVFDNVIKNLNQCYIKITEQYY